MLIGMFYSGMFYSGMLATAGSTNVCGMHTRQSGHSLLHYVLHLKTHFNVPALLPGEAIT